MISRGKEGKKRTYLCYVPLRLEPRDPVYAMSKITFSCQSVFRVSDENAILLLGRTVCKRVENRLWRETRRVEAQTLIAFSKRETRR